MLSMGHEGHTVQSTINDILREYVERASIAIEGSGYPLFENKLGRLVNEAVREGWIGPSPAGVLAGDMVGSPGICSVACCSPRRRWWTRCST